MITIVNYVHSPDMAAVVDVSRSQDDRKSDEKGKVFADPPPPEPYVEVTLAVEEDGKALLILSSSTSKGRAEKESVEFTPHSPAEPIRVGGPDYISACREAGEGKQTEALEHMMDVPPSLPPSPRRCTWMKYIEVQEGPGGVGPSQPPEGHELEDRDKADSGSESGRTEATDNDFTNLARNVHDDTVAPMRPITPKFYGVYGRAGMARTSMSDCQNRRPTTREDP
eukprot:1993135-Pleurochrysis_carterae.AAC.1